MGKHTSVESLQQAIDRLDAADDCIQEALGLLSRSDLHAGPEDTAVAKGLFQWRKYLEGLITDRSDATDAGSSGDA